MQTNVMFMQQKYFAVYSFECIFLKMLQMISNKKKLLTERFIDTYRQFELQSKRIVHVVSILHIFTLSIHFNFFLFHISKIGHFKANDKNWIKKKEKNLSEANICIEGGALMQMNNNQKIKWIIWNDLLTKNARDIDSVSKIN